MTTIGNQTYQENVTLNGTANLTGLVSTSGSVRFDGTLNSFQLNEEVLLVDAAAETIFGGAVGTAVDGALAGLTTNSNIGNGPGVTRINGGAVMTTEDQTYQEPVTLGATTTLAANDVTFVDTLDSAGASRNLSVNTTGGGITTFSRPVGRMLPLGSLTTNPDGTTRINAISITTTGNQQYQDNVTLNSETNITSLISTAGSVRFDGTLNGEALNQELLFIDAAVDTVFGGAVGTAANGALASLTTNSNTGNGAGSTRINGGTVATTGDQRYQENVTLNSDTNITSLTSSAGTLDLSLAGTLDLADNDLVIRPTPAAKPALLSAASGWLVSGYAGGLWNGTGIVSSHAAANPNMDTGLVLADNALADLGEFGGVAVDENSLLLKYTYYGDIDVNGQVDADDLTVFANNFGRTTGATQIDGDIDLDGDVDADDLTVFANSFGKGIGAPLAAAATKDEGRSTKDESQTAAPAGRPGLEPVEPLGATAGRASGRFAVSNLSSSASAGDALVDLLAETIAADAVAASSSNLADARFATSRKASVADALWADSNW
jgi:hypothetical protein